MKNIKLVMEYDGSRYAGWQKQVKKQSIDTIQGRVEEVLKKMTGEDVTLIGGARTEAGVHAYTQIANFTSNTEKKTYEIKHYLNRYLPRDIAVIEAVEVPERFHSSYNLKSVKYQYRIAVGEYAPVFERKYTYYCFDKLDLSAMRKAAEFFIGKQDFKAFSDNKRMKKSTVREIFEIDIYGDLKEVDITIHADDFWPNMARIISGTLIEVGRGNILPEQIPEIIQSGDREQAGPTVEAKGLFLLDIIY